MNCQHKVFDVTYVTRRFGDVDRRVKMRECRRKAKFQLLHDQGVTMLCTQHHAGIVKDKAVSK